MCRTIYSRGTVGKDEIKKSLVTAEAIWSNEIVSAD